MAEPMRLGMIEFSRLVKRTASPCCRKIVGLEVLSLDQQPKLAILRISTSSSRSLLYGHSAKRSQSLTFTKFPPSKYSISRQSSIYCILNPENYRKTGLACWKINSPSFSNLKKVKFRRITVSDQPGKCAHRPSLAGVMIIWLLACSMMMWLIKGGNPNAISREMMTHIALVTCKALYLQFIFWGRERAFRSKCRLEGMESSVEWTEALR